MNKPTSQRIYALFIYGYSTITS